MNPERIHRYKGISLFIKLLIAIGCFLYIGYKLAVHQSAEPIVAFFSSIEFNNYFLYLTLIFLLMLVNWGLESWKWKILVQRLEPISFGDACKSILSGLTLSIFTPNRIGEFGGRIFFLKTADRVKALLLSIVGSYSQLTITLFTGAISLYFYIFLFREQLNEPYFYLLRGLTIIFLISMLALIWLYLNPGTWLAIGVKLKLSEKVISTLEVLKIISRSELYKTLFISAMRYAVFSIQYLLLLRFFQVEIPVISSLMMIALTFFVITIVPTIALTELGIRGSAALLFIGSLSENHIGIISASFMLWVINIALPAIAGIPFIFKLNFFRINRMNPRASSEHKIPHRFSVDSRRPKPMASDEAMKGKRQDEVFLPTRKAGLTNSDALGDWDCSTKHFPKREIQVSRIKKT